MERLSICSFLSHGHEYHLYLYDEVEGVPAGTVVKDANEVLPRSRIFRYPNGGSYAGFSDFFRFKLLLERGNWWADADTVCCRPFDFADPIVISSERSCGGCRLVDNRVLKISLGSVAMEMAFRHFESPDPHLLFP